MQELNWRLQVYSPVGPHLRTIPRDDSWVRSTGLRLRVKPEGDGVEASLDAQGRGLGLLPLQSLQFEYLNNGVWVPLYYGEVRVGGNPRDVDGHTFTLRSLALRLKEVVLPTGFSTPKQAAHLTVRAAIQAVVNSGQLGTPSLVLYDETLCPDLGFDAAAVINANQQTPHALLERIVQDGAGFGVRVVFGVRADRKFYCQVARTDMMDLSDSPLIRWKAPVAETPYTAVLWFLGKRADGSPVTYKSRSPAADLYGERVRPLSLGAEINPWVTAAGTWLWEVRDASGNWSPADPQEVVLPLVTDGKASASDTALAVTLAAPYGRLRFSSPDPIGRVVYAGVIYSVTPQSPSGTVAARIEASLGPGTQGFACAEYGAGWASGVAYVPPLAPPLAYRQVTLGNSAALGDATAVRPQITEFRAERLDTALLDRLAQHHYSTPAEEPADIETDVFLAPLQLCGRVTVGDYTRPVDAWEYRLTTRYGLRVAALTGQAEDPAALARASLIRARDGEAVVTAITAQT